MDSSQDAGGGRHRASAGPAPDPAALLRRIGELEAQLAEAQGGKPRRWPATPPGLDSLWTAINQRMGVGPAFFRQAEAEPSIAWALWDLARFAYLDSPPPALFKEQLFTYLSRFCAVRYCVARHAAFLTGHGNVAGDPDCKPMSVEAVQYLISDPLPGVEEQRAMLLRLANADPIEFATWPLHDSPLGRDFFFACAVIYIHPDRTSDFLGHLRRLLGAARIEQLLLLLGFIRMAHFWTEVHPGLSFEPDLEELVRKEPELGARLLEPQQADRIPLGSLGARSANSAQAERQRFEALAAATAQIVWTTDATGAVREDSPSWRAFTGQSSEEWRGAGWLAAVHPDDREPVFNSWRATVAARRPYSIEYRLRHVSGGWRWTAARASPLFDAEGELSGWVGLNVDIHRLKEAEATARDHQERLRLLVECASNIAIFALDASGRIESWNSGAARITGYEAAEVIGKSVKMLLPEELRDSDLVPSLLVEAQAHGEVKNRGWRVRKNGERFWADVTITPSWSDNGVLRGFSDIVRDLTEERNYISALEESEERSRLLLENAAQGILGVTLDGKIVLINLKACEIFGYRHGELEEQSLEMLAPEALRGDSVGPPVAFGLETNKLPTRAATECLARRKSGEVFPAEVSWSHLRTSKGSLYVAFVTDITERERSRMALKQTLERFRLLSEHVPQLVWTCLPDGRCDYLNQRWEDYTGIPASDQTGYAWMDRLHPDDRENAIKAWQSAVSGLSDMDVEFRLRRFDGAYRWFRTRAAALFDDRGEIVKWFGSNTDVHDLRLAMRELEAANSELESFAYIAAHDMQEPLRTINSFTQLLERELGDKLEGRSLSLMGHVRAAAVRMSQLFTDLLMYTEAGDEAGQQQKELVKLANSAALAVSNLQSAINEAGAKVTIGELPEVRGNRSHFLQVFQNLIGNAIKYRGKNPPEVSVTAASHETHWTIRVADNGMGIAQRDQYDVFKIFRRLHGPETEGTGIGLAICQRIVNRYGGRIWVESAGPGQGSTFVFELPSQ